MASRPKPPAVVKAAIKNYRPAADVTLVPLTGKETSFIYDWGVRGTTIVEGKEVVIWICLAGATCRRDGTSVSVLSSGRTSRAVTHLRDAHKIESSKTASELAAKRHLDQEVQSLLTSHLYSEDFHRYCALIETQDIVNNNAPFKSIEYKERKIKRMTLMVPEARTFVINTELIIHTMIELYASTKAEVTAIIKENNPSYPNFVMMADFWYSPVAKAKFLGLRIFFINNDWERKTVLLGTREFNPLYGDRVRGIKRPFAAWIKQLLSEFGLDKNDFFGATTDAGSDVKAMMRKRLKLEWEWCLAHLANAATKNACGDNETKDNEPLQALIKKIKLVNFETKKIERTGDLFQTLCRAKAKTKATQLLNYTSDRFLSAARAMKRILDMWDAVEAWYRERANYPPNQRNPPVFPLRNSKQTIIQLYSLFKHVNVVKALSQAETCNQIEVILHLFELREDTLTLTNRIEHYKSTEDDRVWIEVDDMCPLVVSTRQKLRDAFDSRFFKRYFDLDEINKCSYIFEMQMVLHPSLKNLDRSLKNMIILCNRQRGVTSLEALRIKDQVCARVRLKLATLLEVIAEEDEPPASAVPEPASQRDRLLDRYGSRPRTAATAISSRLRLLVDKEINDWLEDPTPLMENESILEFWKRMEDTTHRFRLLGKAVRVLFAVPSSSAAIERDFSVSGMLVQSQRASIGKEKVDMCSFLNRNREFVDITQCAAIPRREINSFIPLSSAVEVTMLNDIVSDDEEDSDDEDALEYMISQTLSAATISGEAFSTNELSSEEEKESEEEQQE